MNGFDSPRRAAAAAALQTATANIANAISVHAHSDPRLNSSKLLAISGEQTIFLVAHGVIKCNANDIEKKRGREWLPAAEES